jgi:hypothetical protein
LFSSIDDANVECLFTVFEVYCIDENTGAGKKSLVARRGSFREVNLIVVDFIVGITASLFWNLGHAPTSSDFAKNSTRE